MDSIDFKIDENLMALSPRHLLISTNSRILIRPKLSRPRERFLSLTPRRICEGLEATLALKEILRFNASVKLSDITQISQFCKEAANSL